MQNFFEKNKLSNIKKESTNPFASVEQIQDGKINFEISNNTGRRLNIIDMEVLTSSNKKSEIEFLEIRMNNLYNIIHQNSQNLDPIALEKMKIEWESLRDKLYQERKTSKFQNGAKSLEKKNTFKSLLKGVSKIVTLFKFNSPQIKQIIDTFNTINKEVEDLVKRSTPVGEEEIKYGMLVNKIYQATKLNGRLTNEIK